MKKFLSILLTAALVLSSTPFGVSNVFAADVTVPITVTSGDTELPEGDNLVVTNSNNAIYINQSGADPASVKVNGNVSLIVENAAMPDIPNAVYVRSGSQKASVDISGDVSIDSVVDALGVTLNPSSAGENIYVTANVGGDITATAEGTANGVCANPGRADATFGKNIIAKALFATGLFMASTGKVSVGGDVIADTNLYDDDGNVTDMGGYALGVNMISHDNEEVDIKGDITSTGAEATGAMLSFFSINKKGTLNFNAGKDIIVKPTSIYDTDSVRNNGIWIENDGEYGDIFADVKGDIKVSLPDPKVPGSAIRISPPEMVAMHDYIPGPFYNNVHVHGDVISDDVGIYLYTNGVITNILVEGTINGANKCVEVEKNSETHITAWKMIPNERGHLVEFSGDKNTQFEPLEKGINYIIKTEQPSAGGTFAAVKADGTALEKVEEFDTAHEGEKVYIKQELEEGYTLKAAYNGEGDDKKELSKDDGGYYIVVPQGGGVYLSIDVEEAPKPTPTPEPSATPEVTPTPEATPTPDGNGQNPADDDITKEIPFAENVPVEEKQAVIESANTDLQDVEGSTMQYLGLKAAKVKKNSIKLTWKKVKGADGYIIYGSRCGKKMKYITTLKNANAKNYTAKKLKKGKYYKYLVVAYKTTASGDKVITTSKSVHAATTGGKVGNPTSIKVKKTKVSLKKGKTKKIKASFKKKKKVHLHIAKFRYESLDESIATVSKSGKIKGVGKGTTKVLVYTQNGLSKTIKVTVK